MESPKQNNNCSVSEIHHDSMQYSKFHSPEYPFRGSPNLGYDKNTMHAVIITSLGSKNSVACRHKRKKSCLDISHELSLCIILVAAALLIDYWCRSVNLNICLHSH